MRTKKALKELCHKLGISFTDYGFLFGIEIDKYELIEGGDLEKRPISRRDMNLYKNQVYLEIEHLQNQLTAILKYLNCAYKQENFILEKNK